MKTWSSVVVVALILVSHAGILFAEETSVHSMGLPSRNEFYVGPMVVVDQTTRDVKFGGQIYLGWTRYLTSPLVGIGLSLEGYGQAIDSQEFDGGGRLMARAAPVFLQAGVDYKYMKKAL